MLPLDRFREYLQAHGKRLTREKQIILENIVLYRRTFNVEDVIDGLSRQAAGRRVARSTVYRTVSDLAKAEVIVQFVPDSSLWILNSNGDRQRDD